MYYSQKGIKASGTIDGITISGKDVLGYIEIPVLLKFKIPTQGNFSPSLFADPYAAFLMSAKEKVEIDGMSEEEDIKDNFNTADYGLCFGGSLDFDIGYSQLIIDIRYSLGLKKVPLDVEEPDNKHSVFSLMLGYAFN